MLEQLPADVQALLHKSQQQYQQHARLHLSVDTLGADKLAWCSAHQSAPAVNDRVLTAEEILERATEAFAPLQQAGFTPIISVCAFGKGTAAKPSPKHRVVEGVAVGGRAAAVLRQAGPRVLFAAEGGKLVLLASEELVPEFKTIALAHRAWEWLKRAPYRK